jgi:4-amino-4-deoxy-L-arabinose transferase-like glycosyltransferase
MHRVARSLGKERVVVAVLICLVWAVMVLPNLSVRSFIYEEGTNAENARDMLSHAEFINLTVYGMRWVERPSLLPLLIAGVAKLSGGVDEWSARLPAMISVLLTTLLVQGVARRYVGIAASLFAAAAFFFSPMLLQKLTVAEPDTLVTLLSFGAFVMWWNGTEAGLVSALRWCAISLVLTVLTMAKGPQPLAFFVLGAGAYMLLHRQFHQFIGLVLALVPPAAALLGWGYAIYRPGDEAKWVTYMHLEGGGPGVTLASYLAERARFVAGVALEMLPATLLLPFVPWPWRRRPDAAAPAAPAAPATPPIVEPLILYAGLCTLVLVFWPRAAGRYVMPAAPAVCVLAAIAWDRLMDRLRTHMHRLAAGIAGALAIYQLALVVVIIPLYSDRFGQGRSDGRAIDQAIRAAPAPVYCTNIDTNQLFYVSEPITCLDDAAWLALAPPAWLVTGRERLAPLAAMRPDLTLHVAVETVSGPALVAAQVTK